MRAKTVGKSKRWISAKQSENQLKTVYILYTVLYVYLFISSRLEIFIECQIVCRDYFVGHLSLCVCDALFLGFFNGLYDNSLLAVSKLM